MYVRKEIEALATPYPTDYVHSTTNPRDEPSHSSASTSISPSPSETMTRITSVTKVPIPNARSRSNSLQAIRSLFKSMKHSQSSTDDVVMRRDKKREKLFMRPGVIDEEPDSMDSIISDPSSFPITIVPPVTTGGTGLLIRNTTTHSSFGRLSRISTNSK